MQVLIKKPQWLNKKISIKECQPVKHMLNGLKLHTVCQEAGCPNISECFSKGTATFMILGDICTRDCSFCGVKKGVPFNVDKDEPIRVAEAVSRLGLKHAVITSVTRDDLADSGSGVFADTIRAIRNTDKDITIEVLIPDLKGDENSLKNIIEAHPHIINHNLETVERLYPDIRPQANYQLSLNVLKMAKDLDKEKTIYTKSGIMLGLGEKEDEALKLFSDLVNVGCDFLSIGQYLAPSRLHYPVKDYIMPEQFESYKIKALEIGFRHVESAPYVRSSYCAAEYIGR